MRETTLEHSGAATIDAPTEAAMLRPFATDAVAMPSLGMSGEPISILGGRCTVALSSRRAAAHQSLDAVRAAICCDRHFFWRA